MEEMGAQTEVRSNMNCLANESRSGARYFYCRAVYAFYSK